MDDYAVILFDGDCNFCNYWVKFIIKRDKKDVFRFASLQSEKGKELLLKCSLSFDLSTVVFIENNDVKTKSSAALYILKKLGGFSSLGIVLIVVPKFIRDGVYNIFAKNRKNLIKNESCIFPDEQIKKKFI